MTNNTLSFVFPGQGSQFVGMLGDIAQQYPEVKSVFTEASDALGYDLWAMSQDGPATELDKTEHTQPALLAASYAIWKILSTRMSTMPALLAGHSLGEYTALTCAGALNFSEAIKLVAARGQYMQDAVATGVGAMGAIVGLDDAVVAEICAQARTTDNEILSPANFNSIGQVVVAGHKNAVESALVMAKEKGAKLAVAIPVSVPSHCQLMLPASERLAALLQTITIKTPTLPVISNVDVTVYDSVDAIRNGLVRQLYMPVRWVETVQTMVKAGVTTIVECGPGKVLTGLNKRIDKGLQLTSTNDLASLNALLNTENERSSS